MPKNYSSPLDGVSIEDIMSEVGHESASDSTSSSQRRSGRQIKRQIRLSNSNTLRLEFLPPDPGSYTKGGKGYTIYFNIHSLLTKPIKLSICDSGVFANKRQWNRDYNYTGHTLSNEYVFPTIPRTVGQIFLTENASYEELEKGDFYTVSFECEKNNTLYFYKYVYLGNGQWEFYDYYEVEK